LHVELGEVLLRAGKVNQAIREFDEELRRDPGNLHALVRRGEARLIQENVEAALQDWEKAIAIDVEQTERLLGLREAGFGDSALEQLTDATREKIQKLAGDLQDRNSPAAHLALAFLAEQKGNFSRAATEATLAASTARKDVADKICTEAGRRPSRSSTGNFLRSHPAWSWPSLRGPPLNFAFEWRAHC